MTDRPSWDWDDLTNEDVDPMSEEERREWHRDQDGEDRD